MVVKNKKENIQEGAGQEVNIINSKESSKHGKGKFAVIIAILIVIILVVFGVITNKNGSIKITVKSSLDRIVEKSDFETVNITYNVIAKKCKDEKKCDLNSNDINDFKYVVSCKGTITAGIDFSKIEIEVDEKNKKLIVTMPEASVKGEPTIGKVKFLNGSELKGDKLVDAKKLCQTTTIEKSEKDGKLLPAAKEQAREVLQSFYEQWIKAYDSEYKVEVK